jgi:hypothetical protein
MRGALLRKEEKEQPDQGLKYEGLRAVDKFNFAMNTQYFEVKV